MSIKTLNRPRKMAQKINKKAKQKALHRNSVWSIVFVYIYDFF